MKACVQKMLTYVGIIISCICLVLIAVCGYFLYTKIGTQQTTIEELVHRQLSIEGMLMRPPPRQEVQSLLSDTIAPCEECYVEQFEDPEEEKKEDVEVDTS